MNPAAAPRLLASLALALGLWAGLAPPAWAELSREQAAAVAQRQTGGRVLSVERADSGRRPMWRVKVVTPRGEVRVVFVDASGSPGG
ncbi:MAG: PepSY domain-containing protein [Rhodoferax sp.]|jgi:hypothetical protein